MRNSFRNLLWVVLLVGISCSEAPKGETAATSLPVYKDVPYLQDYSIKYDKQEDDLQLFGAFMDRNGVIQVFSSDGILRTHDGQFLYPGVLLQDKTYRPLTDKNISAMTIYKDQFIYLDDQAVLSNAWAGSLYLNHNLPKANMVAPGSDFDFLISDGPSLQYVSKNSSGWQGDLPKDKAIAIKFDQKTNSFWILGKESVSIFNPKEKALKTIYEGSNFTSFALLD
ncbi:MAG: hypothetical protein RIM68_12380, partial [Arenibacter sp.]